MGGACLVDGFGGVESAEFKPGSTVRLASGGPKMTVKNRQQHNGEVLCCYFDNDDILTFVNLPSHCLTSA